jgi:hypothetical protein
LVPVVVVIPALLAYITIVVVKRLVVGLNITNTLSILVCVLPTL